MWLDNAGTAEELAAAARQLWRERIMPFAHNVQAREAAPVAPRLVPSDPSWPEQARRILARLRTTCGHHAIRIDHIGSTAVPGLAAKDVIDVQVTVPSLVVADDLADALLASGYPRIDDVTGDVSHGDDPALWDKRLHASADPGRPTNVHLRVDGSPGQQFALLFVDWLKANPDVQDEYADAKEPWLVDAYRRAWAWAEEAGWRP